MNTNNRTCDKEPTISKEATYKENIGSPNEGTNNCLLLDKNTGNISHFYSAESELEK